MPEQPPTGTPALRRWAFALATGLLVALGVAGVVLYDLVGRFHLIPTSYSEYLRVGLVLGLGILAVVVVGRIVFGIARRFAGDRHATLITDVYRIVALVALALIVLYALGVNGYALLAGGTFAGLVLGLASQAALANFVAGIVLLISRPFEPGDRLTLTTSQYSILLPVYPPKFYSQDLLIPGFTGTVRDIGPIYTVLLLDEGVTASFPNSIVILGAVIAHTASQRWVRVKYEVPNSVDPALVLDRVRDAVSVDDWVVGKDSVRVYVNQATQTSFVISVDALCRGNLEEPPRSALYVRIMKTVGSLASAASAQSGTHPSNPPPQPQAASPTLTLVSPDGKL